MRNKYAGRCADCACEVMAEEGYFERRNGRFVVRCMKCVVEGKLKKGKPLSDQQLEFLNSSGAVS